MEGLGRGQTRQLEAPGSSIMTHSAATGMSETAAEETVPEGAEPVRQLSAQDQTPRTTFPLLLGHYPWHMETSAWDGPASHLGIWQSGPQSRCKCSVIGTQAWPGMQGDPTVSVGAGRVPTVH